MNFETWGQIKGVSRSFPWVLLPKKVWTAMSAITKKGHLRVMLLHSMSNTCHNTNTSFWLAFFLISCMCSGNSSHDVLYGVNM